MTIAPSKRHTTPNAISIIVLESIPAATSASMASRSACTASSAAIFSAINESLAAFSCSRSASFASICAWAWFWASMESCSIACNSIFLRLCNSLSSMAKREESKCFAFNFSSDVLTASISLNAWISVSNFEFLIESRRVISLFS